jgi:hypothetical protein
MLRNFWASGLAAMVLSACATSGGEVTDQRQLESPDSAVVEPERTDPTSEAVMYNVFAAEYLGSEGDLEGAVGLYLEAALKGLIENEPKL